MTQSSLFKELPDVAEIPTHGKHRPYPQYAPSESPWLGELPGHWKTRRLKFVAKSQPSNVDKKSVDGEMLVRLCNYVDVYKNDYITPNLDFMQATCCPSELAKFRLRRGDVLITKDSEEWNDIAVPAFVTKDFDDVACGYHLSQVRPRSGIMDGEYLFRAFRAGGVSEQFQVSANGVTRFGIAAGAIGDVTFPVPPLDEQRSIARFLREDTSRIDRLIAEKMRFIELLDEKRAAVITHAVIRGFDSKPAMQPSGFHWLPPIPVDWRAMRLRRVVSRIEQGWSPEADSREAGEDEWAVMRAGCANGGHFDETDHKALPLGIEPDPSLEIHPGDLLMSRACGTKELVGSVALVGPCRPKLLLCDKLFRLHRRANMVESDFLAIALSSHLVRYQLEGSLSGAEGLARNIAQSAIRELVVCIPPLAEQRYIMATLSNIISHLMDLKHRVASAVEKLREYRSALITAAITGRIDVRQYKITEET